MSRIRIVFFIDTYQPGAGTENQLRGILQHLDREKFEATLITLRQTGAGQHFEDIPWPTLCLDVPRLLSLNGIRCFVQLVRYLRRIRPEIAMVFFPDSNLFAVPACVLAGTHAIVAARRDMGYWRTGGRLFLLRLVNQLSDYFLVNAEAVKSQVAKVERFPSERIKVIPNGLWNGSGADPKVQTADVPGLPQGAQVVGIVANLRPVKRIDRFIEMAAIIATAVPGAHFLIIGGGHLMPALHQLVSSRGLELRVHFLGKVSDVRRYLPLFTVGVLTSESEGLSNTLIEYAANGVPALAFDVGGNREVIVPGKTGFLFREGDIQGMALSAIGILQDPTLRGTLSEAAMRWGGERFSAAAIQNELHDFLTSLAHAPKRSLRF